jgi:hypothetical protein
MKARHQLIQTINLLTNGAIWGTGFLMAITAVQLLAQRFGEGAPQFSGPEDGSGLRFQPVDPRCTVRGMLANDEADAVRDAFQARVDGKRIRVLFCSVAMGEEACKNNGLEGMCGGSARYSADPGVAHDILMYGEVNHKPNYLRDGIGAYKLLMHEAGHFYDASLPKPGVWRKQYDYTLTDDTPFAELCDEQRAESLSDNAALTFRPEWLAQPRDAFLTRMMDVQIPGMAEARAKTGIETPFHGCEAPRALTSGEADLARRFGSPLDPAQLRVQSCPEEIFGKWNTHAAFAAGDGQRALVVRGSGAKDYAADERNLYGRFFPALADAFAAQDCAARPAKEQDGCRWMVRGDLSDYAARFLDPRRKVVRNGRAIKALNGNGRHATALRKTGDAFPLLRELRLDLYRQRTGRMPK